MATNNFKPFGVGNGANVTSQADYEALAALLTGFTAGKASSAQINKALRQGTVMASVLAQFISDSASVDVLDDGATATILANLKKGMTALTPGRLLNVRVFTASGTYTPSPGTGKIKVRQVGGGGAGGGTATPGANQIASGNGGNGGSYGETGLITAPTSAVAVAVQVGAGGAGVIGANGGAGGTTSFGAYLVSPGGTGGVFGAATTQANSLASDNANSGASTGTALLLSVPGNGGSGAFNISLASNSIKSGKGGDSRFGSGGGGTNANDTPKPGTGYGAGGSGNAAGQTAGASYAGAAGTGGIVIIEEYA